MNKIVAIDGPAGSGQGTVAKRLADECNLLYIDTGAMYRAVAYKMLKENSVPADTINAQIRQDKGDQNLEGSKTKDSTIDQMILKKRQDRKMY